MLSQKSSISLFLNYVSVFIYMTAKIASLLFIVSRSTDHEIPVVSDNSTDLIHVPGSSRPAEPDKVLRDSPHCGRHHELRWQCRLFTSMWPPVASSLMAMNMAPG